jgi:hypothetical protein
MVCNCRKLRIKRSIKVPAISNKVADIPADEFSWRKYGQKPIKGSPHPRYCGILDLFLLFCDASDHSFGFTVFMRDFNSICTVH